MPCSCIGTPTVVTPPSCPTTDNCLKLADIIVACKDAVGPCGAQGTLDVLTSGDVNKPYCHLIAGCGAYPIRLSLLDYDKDIFEVVHLVGSTITWTTKSAATVNKFGTIKIKGCCGELASLFCIMICIKDLCKCAGCTTAESCDPCNGNCIPKLIDVSVGDSSANIDISIV